MEATVQDSTVMEISVRIWELALPPIYVIAIQVVDIMERAAPYLTVARSLANKTRNVVDQINAIALRLADTMGLIALFLIVKDPLASMELALVLINASITALFHASIILLASATTVAIARGATLGMIVLNLIAIPLNV